MANSTSRADGALPEHFDPRTLNREVIATPLLEKINEEKKLIALVRENYPQQVEKYNSVVLLASPQKINGDVSDALQRLVDETLETAGERVQALRKRHRI